MQYLIIQQFAMTAFGSSVLTYLIYRVDDVNKAVYEELGWDPLNVAPLHAI
jgi:hypothetical protein